jgi:hypothetical protein
LPPVVELLLVSAAFIESLLLAAVFLVFFVDFFAALVSLFMAASLFAAGAGVEDAAGAAGAGIAAGAGLFAAGAGVAGAAVCATAENDVTAKAAISAVKSLFIFIPQSLWFKVPSAHRPNQSGRKNGNLHDFIGFSVQYQLP